LFLMLRELMMLLMKKMQLCRWARMPLSGISEIRCSPVQCV